MAYSRYRSSRFRARRPIKTSRRGGVSKPRRRSYIAKKRTYRKKASMSKRSILNTTSRKKRNGMLTFSNTTTTGASTAPAAAPVYVNAVLGGTFIWCPTAMNLDAQSLVSNMSSRTATTCYMRGLSEHIRIQTSSGIPWFHRRVCFTWKGLGPFNVMATESPTSDFPWLPYQDSSNGVQRLFFNENVNNMPQTINRQRNILFKGAENIDWTDPIIAPLDTGRITVKFDKTWTMQSGNTNGIVRERKLWHPMNHNLVYDDDEFGDIESGSWFSTDSKAGMGDYYVMDIIQGGQGGTASDLLRMTANSTMYWHEK
ncbi:capsid protein [Sclerotinia sclerotiorum hypovirulence associated DNA virus 1]|uniref:Capsid protein n=1 Tax=Sclerotinia sclerotiorum hypovirulence associated DNA virus 1 TaxID=664785 RepID=S4X370_9VIRU|nr:capsid protein [Sclerotinia sclerotiorum hypovirulence associated DNA virus 1]